jgi:hypothetical protein
MEEKIVVDQRILVFDIALQDTPTRKWATHRALIMEWEDAKQAIRCRFQSRDQLKEEMNIDFQDVQLFDGRFDPKVYIEHCLKHCQIVEVPSHLWVQVFIHSLGPVPKSWYIHEDTRRQTRCW